MGSELVDPADLIGIAEIKDMLGVGRQRAYIISTRQGFPAPVIDRPPNVRLWRRQDVEAWLERSRPSAGG